MATVSKLRKMLHRKAAEFCSPWPGGSTLAGGFCVSDKSDLIPSHDIAYYIGGASAIWNYNADEDAWMQIPNSGIAGTFAAGSCGEFRALGAPGGSFNQTATGGTTTTISTALLFLRQLKGCEVRVVGGTGIGYAGTIASNTVGSSSILTVTPANAVAFDATTVFQVYSGSLWFFNAGTTAVGFSVYDRATNTWTARSVAGLPTAWASDGQLMSTPGRSSGVDAGGFVNGTATSATSTTLVDSTKTLTVDAWKNYQVRIVSGTGKGQIRLITANTANALTVAAWTTTPDATSVYRIEGNDDVFYLLGNAASVMYKFTVSTNTWSTVAPVAARAGATGSGCTADWIDGVSDSQWTAELSYPNTSTLFRQNGRYIYSFRGAAGNILDVYDIAANTWISGVSYGNQSETFSTGSCSIDLGGNIYIQKDVTGRIYRFDVANHKLDPLVLNPVPQSTAVAGDKMFMTTYKDGTTVLPFLYTLANTRAELVRWLLV